MFNRSFRHAAALLIALASLTACDATPLAPRAEAPVLAASSITSTPSGNIVSRDATTVPYGFVVYASCANGGAGEVLGVAGTLQYTGHWITTTQGQRQHNMTISSFTGLGTGEDTGEQYDVLQRDLYQTNTDYGTDGIPDSAEELQRFRVRLTSRLTGAVFNLTIVGRFVQTATGEFVLAGWDGSARCE
jgi:hypothetical protein